eukprot:6137344-Pyramimonas_sp.AAC.1
MGDVLHELRLYHWTPAALYVAEACVHSQNVARQNGWNLDQDFEVERYRDEDRGECRGQSPGGTDGLGSKSRII